MGIAVARWNRAHPTEVPVPAHDRFPGWNVSQIGVGGDLGGLVFVAGTVVIFVISMPFLRWFLGASVLLACLVAWTRIAWMRAHA
jgi:hypothetical protein